MDHEKAFFNLEVVKTLLLYSEIDPILRVCAHPRVQLERWWTCGGCFCEVSIAII